MKMRLFRIVLILLSALITLSIPTLILPPLQMISEGKTVNPTGWAIVVGFILTPISVPFLWNKKRLGLILLIISTLLVFVGALVTPNFYSGSTRLIQAINFSMCHLILLGLSTLIYVTQHRKET
jgi:hypothetical protein